MNAKKLACAPEDIDIHELWSGESLAMDADPLVLCQSIGSKTGYD